MKPQRVAVTVGSISEKRVSLTFPQMLASCGTVRHLLHTLWLYAARNSQTVIRCYTTVAGKAYRKSPSHSRCLIRCEMAETAQPQQRRPGCRLLEAQTTAHSEARKHQAHGECSSSNAAKVTLAERSACARKH